MSVNLQQVKDINGEDITPISIHKLMSPIKLKLQLNTSQISSLDTFACKFLNIDTLKWEDDGCKTILD